ncbi:MAG: DUF1403 family protein [Mesorhizobium sp.]
MILRPETVLRRHDEAHAGASVVPIPTWLRRAVSSSDGTAEATEDLSLTMGAALAVLDAVIRRQEPWAGVWQHRLALTAAAITAKQMGRVEDEAALRDAILLSRPGDEVGPGGRIVFAWRRLASRPAAELLTAKSLTATLDEFGYAAEMDAVSDLSGEVGRLSTSVGLVEALCGAFYAAERLGYGQSMGRWLADAVLAQRFGWRHAMPLLGSDGVLSRRRRTSGMLVKADAPAGTDSMRGLLAAYARSAVRAIDLALELERRAARLVAVAPKLRGRGSDAVVARLLGEDALVASRGDTTTGMSDRGLRRLFDRLIDLGAVRELSGRPTFRVYGL